MFLCIYYTVKSSEQQLCNILNYQLLLTLILCILGSSLNLIRLFRRKVGISCLAYQFDEHQLIFSEMFSLFIFFQLILDRFLLIHVFRCLARLHINEPNANILDKCFTVSNTNFHFHGDKLMNILTNQTIVWGNEMKSRNSGIIYINFH